MASWSWRLAGALLSAAAIFVLTWWITRGEAGSGASTRGTVRSTAPAVEAADVSREPRVSASSVRAAAAEVVGATPNVAFELRGRLIDETGAAVEGAAVRAGSVQGVSARGGEFALDVPARDLVDGALRIVATAADHRVGATRVPIGRRDPIVVPLAKARTVRVEVRRSGGGPVAGVVVDAVASDDALGEAAFGSGVTASDGSVALSGLPAIALDLRTRSPDAAPVRQLLGRGSADVEAHVVVEPGPALALVVRDEAQKPVAGARAEVVELARGSGFALVSDALGNFPATVLTKDPHRIVVRHSGHATATEVVQLTASIEKSIVLRDASALEVELAPPKWQRDGDGAWIVEARSKGRDDLPPLRGAADSGRRVVLEGAGPGTRWSLAATFLGRAGALSIGPVRVAADVLVEPKRTVVPWSLPALFRVNVACRDAQGVPIRDTVVSLVAARPEPTLAERCDFAADEFGSAVGWVAGGVYRIEAASPTANAASPPAEITVREDCSVDLVFARGRTVRGTVAAADGKPLCREVVAEGSGTTRRSWSDAAGRFELPGVAAGACRVRAIGRYGGPDAASLDVVVGESDVDDCRLVLPASRIVGKVVGQRGERARVTATAGDAHGDVAPPAAVVVTWTDARGNFRIDDVDGGAWSLVAETESEYGKDAAQTRQAGGVGRWSGVVRGATDVEVALAWK